MKRLIPLVVAALLLASCGDDTSEPKKPEAPEASADRTYADSGANWFFEVVRTPTGPLECVVSTYYLEGSATCNWEKYNNQNEEQR